MQDEMCRHRGMLQFSGSIHHGQFYISDVARYLYIALLPEVSKIPAEITFLQTAKAKYYSCNHLVLMSVQLSVAHFLQCVCL